MTIVTTVLVVLALWLLGTLVIPSVRDNEKQRSDSPQLPICFMKVKDDS
jgi:hypothetical protein